MARQNGKPVAYAAKHRDVEVRLASRSGGAFTALSDIVLAKGGVVYGCALDHAFRAVHIRDGNPAERNRCRGSKYVQSDVCDVFEKTREDLRAGRTVLFSGTSCQIAGLNRYLQKENTDALWTVDVFCRGVPSPAVFWDYLHLFDPDGKMIGFEFRNKRKFGWYDHAETRVYPNRTVDSWIFTRFLYGGNISRPACHQCPYKDMERCADFSLGDCWGIQKNLPAFDDGKGVSLVLINNEAAQALWRQCDAAMESVPVELQQYMQRVLQRPDKAAETREKFWVDYHCAPFSRVIRKYGTESPVSFVVRNIRKLVTKAQGGKC